MWALRRITGRRLWERPWDDELTDDLQLDPNSHDPTHGPAKVAPTRYVASRRRKREIVASPTPVRDLRRRSELRRPRPVSRRRRVAALGLAVGILIVVAIALGVMLVPRGPQGQVLDLTGRPQSSQLALVPSYGASSSPGASTVQVPVAGDSAAPVTAIASVTKAPIPGHSVLRVSVRWSVTDPGSGVDAQLFQWRIDHGNWITVRLPSLTTHTVALKLPPGHTYTFRVRATDQAGNVGAFASRQIRI